MSPELKTGIQYFKLLIYSWIPAYETVSQFILLSFRPKGEIFMTNNINMLRFLTFVRNDIFTYCDTVSSVLSHK